MQHSPWIVCATLALGGIAHAQDDAGMRGSAAAESSARATVSADGSGATADVAGGTEFAASLSRPVDAGRNEPGDEVTATASEDISSGGQVVVPRGSKLIGRVTRAQPRGAKGEAAAGAESQLGIVFERAVLKDGREVPLKATVRAVAAARSAASGGLDGGMSGAGHAAGSARGAGGGLLGGAGGVAGGAVGTVGGSVAGASGTVRSTAGGAATLGSKSAGAIGGVDAAGRLTPGSHGVFGLKDLEIASSAAGSAEGAVITSSKRTVRLESGTQLQLVARAGETASGDAGDAPGAQPGSGVHEAPSATN